MKILSNKEYDEILSENRRLKRELEIRQAEFDKFKKLNSINGLVGIFHELSKSKGWYDKGEVNIPEKLALIHSEISEALDEYRHDRMKTWFTENGKPEGFMIEIADAVIRIFDLVGFLKEDLTEALHVKHKYNLNRPYRHGDLKA